MLLRVGALLSRQHSSGTNILGLSPAAAWDLKTGPRWTDTAGTTAATDNDALVARIDDISGNGRHWTQATASKRARLKTGANPYVLSDGIDDLYDLSGTALDGTATTLAIAAQLVSGTGYRVGMIISKQIVYLRMSTSTNWGGYNTQEVTSGVTLSGDSALIEVSRAANSVDFYTNTVASKVTRINGTAYTARTAGLLGVTTQFANARFYRGAVWLREITAGEVPTVLTWLGEGMGVTL